MRSLHLAVAGLVIFSQTAIGLQIQHRADVVDPFSQEFPSPPAANQAEEDEKAVKPGNQGPDINGIAVKIQGTDVIGAPDDLLLSQYYDTIIIVNKDNDASNPKAQTLELHRFRGPRGRRVALETKRFPVSTGEEQWACVMKKVSGRNVPDTIWTGTPTGFYHPMSVEPDRTSYSYHDAKMYNAVFFKEGGFALHQGVVPMSTVKDQTGKSWRVRASHGCIRVGKNEKGESGPQEVMKAVLKTGQRADPNSRMFQAKCVDEHRKFGSELEKCLNARDARTAAYRRAARDVLSDPTMDGPYEEQSQIVPLISRSGKVKYLDRGEIDVKSVPYKTLVIVQCVDKNGRDCSTRADSQSYSDTSCSNKPIEPMQPKDIPQNFRNPITGLIESIGSLFGGGQAPQQQHRPSHQRSSGPFGIQLPF